MKNLISDLCKQQYRYVVRIKDVYNQLCKKKAVFVFLPWVSCQGLSTILPGKQNNTETVVQAVPTTTTTTTTTATTATATQETNTAVAASPAMSVHPAGTTPPGEAVKPVGGQDESPIPSAPPYSDDSPPTYEESQAEAAKAKQEVDQLEAELQGLKDKDKKYEENLRQDNLVLKEGIKKNKKDLAKKYLKMVKKDIDKCQGYETKITAKEASERRWSKFGDNHCILRLVTDNILVSRRKQKSALVGMVNIYRESAKQKAQDAERFITEYYKSVYDEIKEEEYDGKYTTLYNKKKDKLTKKTSFWGMGPRVPLELDERAMRDADQEAKEFATKEATTYITNKAKEDSDYKKYNKKLEGYTAHLLNIENNLATYLKEAGTVHEGKPQITPKPHFWQG